MALIKVLNGDQSGQTITLSDREVVLGRHPGCDIRITDDTVSRHHARILPQGNGFQIEDLGSRNGTYLNGRSLTAPTRLSHLDRIEVFDTTVEFLDERPSRPLERAPLERAPLERAPLERAIEKTVAISDGIVHRPKQTRTFETTAEIPLMLVNETLNDRRTDVKLQAVLEITRYLRSTLQPDEVLSRIVECATHIFPHFSRSYLLRHDATTDQFHPVVIRHPDEEFERRSTTRPFDQALARQVLNEGKAVLSVGDPAADGEAFSVHEAPPLSFMCAPLLGPTLKPAGILYIETLDEVRGFNQDDLEVFACVSILAGQAIEQATHFGARYRAVVDNAVDGIITISDRGTIESVNDAVVKLFGYGEDELLGKNVNLLMTEDDRQRYEEHLAESLQNGKARVVGVGREVLARRNDGTSFPIYLSIGHFELGGRQYYTAIVHDVSERHRAEAALRRANETLEQQVRDRTEYIRLLQEVAVIANQSESVEQAFQHVLQRVLRFRNWDVAHVVLRSRNDPEAFLDSGIWTVERTGRYRRLIAAAGKNEFRAAQGMIGRVIASSRAEWISDISRDNSSSLAPDAAACGLKAAVACPVLIGKEVAAVVRFFSASAAPVEETFLEVMKHVGTQLGRVIERDRLQRQLVDAVWNQHRWFGQELHDTLGQALTGIGMLTDSLAKRLAARGEAEAGQLVELVSMIQQAKTEVRQLAKGMYPVDVDAEGLLAALEELAVTTQQRSEIRCEFRGDRTIQIHDNEVTTHLFRIAQEAVHNAVKHGRPKRITIALSKPRGRVTLAIRDDGSGIDAPPAEGTGGLGMRIMQYRANAIGAQLAVAATGTGGTVVSCTLKREENHAATNHR